MVYKNLLVLFHHDIKCLKEDLTDRGRGIVAMWRITSLEVYRYRKCTTLLKIVSTTITLTSWGQVVFLWEHCNGCWCNWLHATDTQVCTYTDAWLRVHFTLYLSLLSYTCISTVFLYIRWLFEIYRLYILRTISALVAAKNQIVVFLNKS